MSVNIRTFCSQACLNDTDELEAKVTVLEESVADLEGNVAAIADEVDDVESHNILQDQRLNIIETDISDNENDIEGLPCLMKHMWLIIIPIS